MTSLLCINNYLSSLVPVAETSDWIKASITTGFGFLLAAVLEPLKTWYSDRHKTSKMEGRLYTELASNYATVIKAVETFNSSQAKADIEYAITVLQYSI